MAISIVRAINAFDASMLELNTLTSCAYRFIVGYGFGYAIGYVLGNLIS